MLVLKAVWAHHRLLHGDAVLPKGQLRRGLRLLVRQVHRMHHAVSLPNGQRRRRRRRLILRSPGYTP